MFVVICLFFITITIYFLYHPEGKNETDNYLFYIKKARIGLRERRRFKRED